MPMMSIREYANHRGVTPTAVMKWKNRGFLKGAFMKRKGWRWPKINQEKADKLLEGHLTQGPPAAPKAKPGAKAKKPKAKAKRKKAGTPESASSAASGGNDDQGKSQDQTFAEARAHSERIRAEKMELELEILKGTYIERAVVASENFRIGRLCRDQLLNIPARISAIIAVETDPFKIQNIMTDEITRILEDLTQELKKVI